MYDAMPYAPEHKTVTIIPVKVPRWSSPTPGSILTARQWTSSISTPAAPWARTACGPTTSQSSGMVFPTTATSRTTGVVGTANLEFISISTRHNDNVTHPLLGNEFCVAMNGLGMKKHTNIGTWRDANCGDAYYFICKQNPWL